MEGSRPIIVIKKKVSHGGHHGGAWKVAYADFVTAMMALFIVLWLLNMNKPAREAIAGYFKDPSGTANLLGTSVDGKGEAVAKPKDDMGKLKEELEKAIRQMPNFEKLKDQIEITVTSEGLRIELLESASGTFFTLGAPNPNDDGKQLLNLLAGELGKLPNKISIEGHTDSKPYSGKRNYGNWELSTDRANSARRLRRTGSGWTRLHKYAASPTNFHVNRLTASTLQTGAFPLSCNMWIPKMLNKARPRRQ
jgi:chemotaxis protein MotB